MPRAFSVDRARHVQALGVVLTVIAWLVPALPALAESLYGKPVYNPETKSYFELVSFFPGDREWEPAARLAASRQYRGVSGRLAVVKSRATNDFLRETFKPGGIVWIGLRYFCLLHKAMWVNGEIYSRADYSNWDTVWNRAGTSRKSPAGTYCEAPTFSYWPVHYWAERDVFAWNANGTHKGAGAMFVEYPTGKE